MILYRSATPGFAPHITGTRGTIHTADQLRVLASGPGKIAYRENPINLLVHGAENPRIRLSLSGLEEFDDRFASARLEDANL
jgi:hypothetical protein